MYLQLGLCLRCSFSVAWNLGRCCWWWCFKCCSWRWFNELWWCPNRPSILDCIKWFGLMFGLSISSLNGSVLLCETGPNWRCSGWCWWWCFSSSGTCCSWTAVETGKCCCCCVNGWYLLPGLKFFMWQPSGNPSWNCSYSGRNKMVYK